MSLIVSRLLSLFAVLVTGVALAACSAGVADSGGAGRTITHEMGTTEISGEPHRVVALEYSFVQALDSLGVEPVGIADDDEPERVQQLLGKKIDYRSVGTRLEPNLELVANLQPDLIIADLTRHSKIADQLRQIAPTIVLNSWEGSYDDIKNSVVTIADALGEKADGEKAVKAHEAKMADLTARIPAGEKRRYLLAVATPDGMSLHTSAAFTGSVFKALGLTPALEGKEATESNVGLERLVAVNPDVLFVATDGPGTVYEQWPSSPAWASMSAARNWRNTPIMLLDEPTTYLDIAHQLDVLDLLAELNRERGTTIVMVVHDLNQAAHFAHHVVAVHGGRVHAAGPPESVLTESLIRDVFGVGSVVITHPVTLAPLCLPLPRTTYGAP